MSGIGLVLSIAKVALAAQASSMDVTAHNIANVNTPGYSRQSPVFTAKHPAAYGGVLLGRGVDMTQVMRFGDQFIENRLMQQKSSMFSYEEMENYMQVLEGLFNESSVRSVSTMLADFWNSWHDIANNPSQAPERIAFYERSNLLSEQFNTLDADLRQLETDLTNAVSAGIYKINQITEEIAHLNNQLVGMEVAGNANDLRDKRNTLVSELSEFIDLKTFEQENGSLSVVVAKGCILVYGNDSYKLKMGGDTGDRILWQGSGDATIDITDHIITGKLGGWLDVRDEVIAKCKLDLDALVKEFVWSVNQQHSQGVGLEGFSTVTGTYVVSDNGEELGTEDSGLYYYDEISDGTFKIWIYDSNGDVVTGSPHEITIDADVDTLTALIGDINGLGANITASETAGKLKLDADSGYTFAFSDDTSNVLAALGINTFFTGATAGGMGINDKIGSDKNYIAAAQVASDGTFAAGDNTNALAIADLQYAAMDISQWTCDRRLGNTPGTVNTTIEGYYHSMVGSIGIKSESISRGRAFNEVMVNKLGQVRDNISAVSLDEEMTNLIKFQHAYAAAARLINISDEMLNTLLSVK